MRIIDKLQNGYNKARKNIQTEQTRIKTTRLAFASRLNRGAFEIQDIFYMFIVGIMIYVFVSIWNPVLALFNFTGIPYGSILQLILSIFGLVIAAGYLAYMIKKWQSPN
jgi:hypothetical protein